MTNVQVSRKEFETYLRIKKLIEEGHKCEDLVRPTLSSVIIQSKGMEPRQYDSLSDTVSHWGFETNVGLHSEA